MLSLRNYIPVVFSLYILFLPIVIFQKINTQLYLIMFLILVIPLITYFLIMLKEGINKSIKYKRLPLILLIPLMAFITHLSYGIALIYGRIKSFL